MNNACSPLQREIYTSAARTPNRKHAQHKKSFVKHITPPCELGHTRTILPACRLTYAARNGTRLEIGAIRT